MNFPSTLLFWVLGIAGSLYLLAAARIFFFQRSLIYLPSRVLWRTPGDAGLAFENVTLTAEDGVRLHGWFVPSPRSRGAVLFFHGNAGNISYRVETAYMFHNWDLDVLMIDYRGYGKSEGTPSEAGTRLDSIAAWNYLVQQKGITPEHIIVHGRSLGSAVAVELAAQVQPGAAILESGFTSVADLGSTLYPWLPVRFLTRHFYPSIDSITRLRCPVMVAHSRDDELIPFAHGKRLFEAAPEPKVFFEMRGTHAGCVAATGERYEQEIRAFIDNVLTRRISRSPA